MHIKLKPRPRKAFYKIDYEGLKNFKPDLRGISAANCHDRCVYALISKHIKLGVFISEHKCFIGIKTDNGVKYLYSEQHCEVSEPYGRAKPYEFICELPTHINYTHECECFAKLYLNDDLFEYLCDLEESCESRPKEETNNDL